MEPLKTFITQQQSRNASLLQQALADANISRHANAAENTLLQAMRYSLLDGGKRIRPVLCCAAAEAVAKITPATEAFAAALECIHAYSLVHDDLPAMDDDHLRRGKATCHIAFGEASAILAGDALQCLAFELAVNAPIEPEHAVKAVQIIATAAGATGMVLGQAIDLASVDKTPSLAQMQLMHQHKTGALIEAAVVLGGLSAYASEQQLAQLKLYAQAIGLAFQVQDDILDVTSDTETLGKQQGADAERNKPTYVTLLGLEAAQQKAQELVLQALAAIAEFGDGAIHLRNLAHYIINRDH